MNNYVIFILLIVIGILFSSIVSSNSLQTNESVYNSDFNFTKSSHHGVTLISWRWTELEKYFLIGAFLLIASGVKICYHHSRVLNTHVPESCVLIILGTLLSLIFYLTDIQSSKYVPKFDSNLFFYLLLPPIILESSYSLHDKSFFNNIGTILLYAVVGTLMNVFLIGPSLYLCGYYGLFNGTEIPMIECLVFATLISAVDPVAVLAIFQEVNINKALYFLVFGESLLNDAVVITMYNTVTIFVGSSQIPLSEILMAIICFLIVSFGGISIGLLSGAISSLTTRLTTHVRVVEPLIVLVFAYISYIGAELFHFSGIIALICCGLIQTEYTKHNISKKSYTTIKYLTKTLSSIADVIIFLFLGMVLVRDGRWNTQFVVATLIFCIVYRFVSVFSLTYIANNFFQRLRVVNFSEQILMAYGGLRGAIAFSLVIMLDNNEVKNAPIFISSTLFVILFTVFVMGSTTKPIVRLLQVKTQIKHEARLFIEINTKVMETVMAGIEEVAGHRSANYWSQKFSRFNETYVRSILVVENSETSTIKSIKRTYEKVNDAVKGKTKIRTNSWKRVIDRKEKADNRKPQEENSRDISRALADAFSRSAYYQHSGGIHSVDDLEQKMCKEARKNRWVTAKNKISFAKAIKDGSGGALHSIVKAATAMKSIGQEALDNIDLEKGSDKTKDDALLEIDEEFEENSSPINDKSITLSRTSYQEYENLAFTDDFSPFTMEQAEKLIDSNERKETVNVEPEIGIQRQASKKMERQKLNNDAL